MRGEEETARRRDGETASRGDAGVARVVGIARVPGGRHGIDPEMVEIRPEPSPAERTAILMALEKMLGATPRDERTRIPAWAAAGRREALLAGDRGSRAGWGRGWDRLADW